MFRIISTSRLSDLDAHASALPLVRAKCDGLEKDLESEKHRSQALARDLERACARYDQQLAETARSYEERLAAAGRSARLNDRLVEQANGRAYKVERMADEKVRELRHEVEQLKAKLAASPGAAQDGAVVFRYKNLVHAPIDLTLHVKSLGPGYPQVELKLVLLCAGCGYTQHKTRETADTSEARARFLTGDYEPGTVLKRWAQEHAEKCRAAALPLQRTA
ncbi:hypothetical protein ACF1FX_32555 [Streptomyces sp. NPDC014646]|uniref:hypothetical protein n=1 Tax=Streptomyces sp. NPDC014646 TaxID=3364877 RepID=UPI0036FDF6D3